MSDEVAEFRFRHVRLHRQAKRAVESQARAREKNTAAVVTGAPGWVPQSLLKAPLLAVCPPCRPHLARITAELSANVPCSCRLARLDEFARLCPFPSARLRQR